MKPIIEQNNIELRETVQMIWDIITKENRIDISEVPFSKVSPAAVRPLTFGWSYNANTGQYRYQPENGQTRFYQEKELPPEGREALGLMEPEG